MKDSKTTILELKQKIAQFQNERGWNPEQRELAISIAIEAGELLEHFQWNDHATRRDKDEIENELPM